MATSQYLRYSRPAGKSGSPKYSRSEVKTSRIRSRSSGSEKSSSSQSLQWLKPGSGIAALYPRLARACSADPGRENLDCPADEPVLSTRRGRTRGLGHLDERHRRDLA